VSESLAQWIEREYRYAAKAMLWSISPVGIVKERPFFGQTIRPKPGSIVASPILASHDPDPDYFFHWFRDAAVIVDALRLLYEDGSAGEEALTMLRDFVRFSLDLNALDGRRQMAATPDWRSRVQQDFLQFVRSDDDLAAACGEAVAGEVRVNPDGTLDISRWNRPQHDGSPLRALAMLRWLRALPAESPLVPAIEELTHFDLAQTFGHCAEPSFDIWEEQNGRHYYTLLVSAAALEQGGNWLQSRQESELADRYRQAAAALLMELDGFWQPEPGYFRSGVLVGSSAATRELDAATVLGVNHAAGAGQQHSAQDPRLHATLTQLDEMFDAAYAINRRRAGGPSPLAGPAWGRYAGDRYISGGAWYFTTLGAAEFCFRAARGAEGAQSWIERGDAYLETVRAFTPPGGEMSEQFDQNSGAQTSAKHLAWSYAAFISCIAARREVLAPANGLKP
jgi:glucoamylase